MEAAAIRVPILMVAFPVVVAKVMQKIRGTPQNVEVNDEMIIKQH